MSNAIMARMGEATCAHAIPGYRFAHPGYVRAKETQCK